MDKSIKSTAGDIQRQLATTRTARVPVTIDQISKSKQQSYVMNGRSEHVSDVINFIHLLTATPTSTQHHHQHQHPSKPNFQHHTQNNAFIAP